MTDRKLNNIARAGAFALLVLFFILVAIGAAFGQEDVSTKGAHDHRDSGLIGLNNRVWAVDVLYLEPIENGYRLEVKASDKHQVRYETFTIGKATDIDPEILKKPKGQFVFLIWCGDDRFVYLITPVRPEQIKKR